MRTRTAVCVMCLAATAFAPRASADPGPDGGRDLGVSVRPVDEDIAGNMGLDSARGALVVAVEPGSAAAGAGIEVNDIILTVGGQPVGHEADLMSAVSQADRTKWIPIELWRGRQPLTVSVYLGPGAPPEKPSEKKPKKIGKVEVSGYIQVHYLHSADTNGDGSSTADRFRVLRARVSFKGLISKHVGYDMMIDARSPSITGLLRDAFIELKYIPRHDIRIGQQKTQFGYENPESSTRLFFVNRSELSDSLMRGINLRDIGVGLIGNVPFSDRWRFEDAITVVNGNGLNPPGTDDNNDQKNVWGRVGVRYKSTDRDLTAWLGVSGAQGDQLDEGDDPADPSDDFLFDFRRMGADFELDHKWFFLAMEYAQGTDIEQDSASDSHGYYVLVAGKTPWRVGPLLRYDTLQGDFERWTAGAYYGLPKEDLRVLLNYERRDLEDGVPGDDRWYLQLQVVF